MVRHRDYRKDKYAPFYLRKRIYDRDAGQCQYCGVAVTMAECNIDHVIPRTHRGTTSKQNLVVACHSCNELKYTQLIPEELRPRRGETLPGRRERKLTKKGRKIRERNRARIAMIRLAGPMGIYLDDLFSKGALKQWKP